MRHLDVRGWVLPVTLLLAVEGWMRWHQVQSEALARPSEVVLAWWQSVLDGSLWLATLQTLGSALGGLALGAGLGLLGGLVLGLSQRAANSMALSVELLRPVPSVALIPIAMLVFGFGYRMEVSTVAFASFWPMLMLTQTAIRQVEPRLLEVCQMLRLPPLMQITQVVLPAASRRIFVAFRLCAGVALVVAVTVEITANPQGLGYGLMSAQQSLRPDLMFAWLAWLGVLGYGVGELLRRAELRWFSRGPAS